jgi:hypothetical protein
MTTRSIGKDTKTIGINLPDEMVAELARRAQSMSIPTSVYCKMVFQQWIDSGERIKLNEG